VEIWKEFMDFHRDLHPLFSRRANAEKKFAEFLRKLLKDEEAQVLIALVENKIVAYSITKIDKFPPVFIIEKYAQIYDMAVKGEYRRAGIGEKLMEKIQAWVKSQGLYKIELRVVCENIIGVSFWRKMGFKEYMFVMGKEI
jgi:ribosomal protein S18 acetylase RimI-like enzyme